jgi:hypothetical protein
VSTVYRGIASDSTTPIDVAVVQATPGTPIVVEATAHGLADGDLVQIFWHAVTVKANGTWRITKITANTFSLDTSTDGAGAADASATGYVRPLTREPSFTIPADGDARSAASVNVATEAIADRVAWLESVVGARYLYSRNRNALATQGIGALVNPTAWAGPYNVTNVAPGLTHLAAADLWAAVYGDIEPSDYIEYDITLSVDTTVAGGGACHLYPFASVFDNGAADPGPTYQLDGGVFVDAASRVAVHMHGMIVNPGALTHGGRFNLQVQATGYAGGGGTNLSLIGDALIECRVWRVGR